MNSTLLRLGVIEKIGQVFSVWLSPHRPDQHLDLDKILQIYLDAQETA
jgi:hypothetical protein